MSAVHFHLIITHVPLLGTLIAAFLLIAGQFGEHSFTRKSAYVLLIICGLSAFMSSASGEQAEILLQSYPRFEKAAIAAHKKLAGTSFVFSAVLGLCSMFGIWIESKEKPIRKFFGWVCVFYAIINFSLFSYVAYHGGQIAHDEIRMIENTIKNTN
jgi:hypothetical protein